MSATRRSSPRSLVVWELGTHELSDSFAGARQSFAERVMGGIADPGGVFAGKIEELTEDVGDAMAAVEALQHCRGATEPDLVTQMCGGGGVGGGEAVAEIGSEFIEARGMLFEGEAAAVEQMVDGDAVGPCGDASFTAPGTEPGDDLEHHLLGGVLGVTWWAGFSERDAVDVVSQTRDELFERNTVTVAGGDGSAGVTTGCSRVGP